MCTCTWVNLHAWAESHIPPKNKHEGLDFDILMFLSCIYVASDRVIQDSQRSTEEEEMSQAELKELKGFKEEKETSGEKTCLTNTASRVDQFGLNKVRTVDWNLHV